MRQTFDIGDLIEVTYPASENSHGIVLETRIINNHLLDVTSKWHVDEYSCKIKFMGEDTPIRWVRAKWLRHLSKI